MFDFIQRFIYLFLTLQEKFLSKKLGRNFKSIYSNTTSKRAFTPSASLELNSQTKKNKIKLENDLTTILKKYENNPEKLLKFIHRSRTKVYKIPFANKILNLINCEEGFISTTKGLKSLYLCLAISFLSKEKIKLSLKTEPMFVLRDLPLDPYYMIQQFHKWYAMKLNLPGFDAESQENFQKFMTPANDSKIGELSVEEILGLKEAIARDVEAINFIVDLAKSTSGSKNALKKISTGGASV